MDTSDRERAEQEPATSRPSEDPVRVERSEGSAADEGGRRGQPLANADGTPNVMPPDEIEVPVAPPEERDLGTDEDPAARPLDAEPGSDNLREGRGGGTANPALAEGGEGGEGG